MNNKSLLDCWKMIRREHDDLVDRLLCDPQLRRQFPESVSSIIPKANESNIQWTLLGMRKQKKLAKIILKKVRASDQTCHEHGLTCFFKSNVTDYPYFQWPE